MSSQPLHVRGAGKRWRGKPKRPLPPAAPVEASPLDPSCIVVREEGPGAGLVYRADPRPLCASTTDASAEEVTPPTYAGLRVQPSLMWGWGRGNGFCGETCLQQALMWHGNYVSAERIRYAAGNNELLVGVHDKKAAKALRLAYDSFDSESIPEPQHDAFAGWAAWHVGLGHHVTAGWYTFTDAGDDEYDHIMPIVGVRTRSASAAPEGAGERPVEAPAVIRKGGKALSPPRESLLQAGATVTALDFLDLAQDKVRRVQRGQHGPDGTLFASRAGASVRNATECGAAYPPADATGYVYALPTDTLYGIAITGNAGPPSERFCLSLRPAGDCPDSAGFAAAGLWREPDWGAEDGLDEAPVPLTVSGFATGLRPDAPYALLRFDDPAAVPEKEAGGKGLDAGRKWRRKWTFIAPAESVELRAFDTVPSDGACFYRLVPTPPPPPSS